VQLGLDNKNKTKTIWAAALGGLALIAVVYQIWPLIMGPSGAPDASAQAAAPTAPRVASRTGTKGKKTRPESLDPTLKLDLLAATEQTQYQGQGRNIFVSQAEEVVIETPKAPPNTDPAPPPPEPPPPPPPQIPLKFFGFASRPGEAKKIFLSQAEDVWVAGEGEIVNRRYKVVRIATNSVEMQDVVYGGPPQNLPLTPQ